MTDDDASETVDERPQRERASQERFGSSGRYTLGPVLGRGGMGEVLEARDNEMGRDVAIKRLLLADPSADDVERFLREARVQGRLDHPSVPPVYELARDANGRPFFVMKRLAGTTLAEILERDDLRFTRQRLLRAFAEVCNAVELAHNRGVIHRDLKPSNIMLGDLGEVYVLDWGVAKVRGVREIPSLNVIHEDVKVTASGAVIGTRQYMAPEQLAGSDIDHRADVFALGCVLFEILTGKRLFGRDRSASDYTARRPSDRTPDRKIPPELDEICMAATEPSLDARTSNASAIGNAVQRFLDGDRDFALRAQLASGHLERARAALEEGIGERAQRVAMQEAARALAIDPGLLPAADIVSRLMLEPPREVPPEVHEALREDDVAHGRSHARVGLIGFVGYVLFSVAMLFADVREPRYVTALLLVSLVSLAGASISVRWSHRVGRAVFQLLSAAVLTALLARMFSPVLLAGPVAAITATMLTRTPMLRGRATIVAATLILSTVGSLVLEQLHWIPATFHTVRGVVTIDAPAIPMNFSFGVMAAAYMSALILIASLVSRGYMESEREMRTALHMHAWRLRHLVPKPGA